MWWNDEVKAAVRIKEAAWKVFASSNEEAKEGCMEAYRDEKEERLKGVYIRAKGK